MAIILDSFEIIEENEEIKFTSGFPELFKMHLNNSKIDKKSKKIKYFRYKQFNSKKISKRKCRIRFRRRRGR